jgi:hypothetical protein
MAMLVYHDAAWANVADNTYVEDPTEQQIENKEVYSQLGYLIFLVEKKVLDGEEGRASLVDWRSHTCPRVCRSTFAGETMSCAEAMGAAIALRGYLMEILRPELNLREVDADIVYRKCALQLLALIFVFINILSITFSISMPFNFLHQLLPRALFSYNFL